MNHCPRTVVCNTCELIDVSVGIFNFGENIEDEDDYGFSKNPLLL